MVHILLFASIVLFVLWIVGLAGAWAASAAWTLFVIACILFVAWILASTLTGRRRTVV